MKEFKLSEYYVGLSHSDAAAVELAWDKVIEVSHEFVGTLEAEHFSIVGSNDKRTSRLIRAAYAIGASRLVAYLEKCAER